MSRTAMHSGSGDSPADVSVTVHTVKGPSGSPPRPAEGRKQSNTSASGSSREHSPVRATWARSAGPYVRMSAPDLAASDDSQASSPQEQSRAVQRRRKALRRPSAPQLVSPFALPEVQQQTVPPEPVKASQMVSKSRSKPRTRVPAEPPAKPETAPLVPHPIATKPPKAPVAKPAPASRYPEASPVTTPTSSQQQSCDSLTMKSDVKGAVVGAPKQVLADKTAGTYMSSPEAHNVRVVEHASCWPRWLACFSRA